jgi:hypothetical protein
MVAAGGCFVAAVDVISGMTWAPRLAFQGLIRFLWPELVVVCRLGNRSGSSVSTT